MHVDDELMFCLDVDAIRNDFPILKHKANRPPIYLDNAATSQKPHPVIKAMDEYYCTYNANVHRGLYPISDEASVQYEQAREKVARFINARSASEVIFTRNTTESINLVAYSWGNANLRAGDEILVTAMEHHSNLLPWQLLAERVDAKLRCIELDDEGTLRLDDLDRVLTKRTRLLAMTHVSNVLGTINPIQSITEAAHAMGAKVLVDAAQSVPHLPVDVKRLDCDFLAFSGHKMCGPTGIGVLYGKLDLLEGMPPFLAGGSMIRTVGLKCSTYADTPARFEAGTPSIAEAIGLGAAVDYLTGVGLDAICLHERRLLEYAYEKLNEIDGMTLYGLRHANKVGVIPFNIADVDPHDLASFLGREGIAIRAGHHCAQPLMQRLGVSATARASFYLYNRLDEIDRLHAGILKAQKILTHQPTTH